MHSFTHPLIYGTNCDYLGFNLKNIEGNTMDEKYLLIFSFLFINTLVYKQSYKEEKLCYKESEVVAHYHGGRFREGDKLPTPKLIFGVRMGYDFLI